MNENEKAVLKAVGLLAQAQFLVLKLKMTSNLSPSSRDVVAGEALRLADGLRQALRLANRARVLTENDAATLTVSDMQRIEEELHLTTEAEA